MIQIRNLFYKYPSSNKLVLDDVNFDVEKKSILSLIGPNGSGKSTLLRLMAGLLKASERTVFILEKDIKEYKKKELSQTISFLPQLQSKVGGLSVNELVSMGRTPYQKSGWLMSKEDKKIVNWAMEYMQITDLKDKIVKELSGGQAQRVRLAMVLAQDTPIILLDEPVTYLDLHYQSSLLSSIRKLSEEFDKTFISVFHDINQAIEISDKMLMLNGGKIFAKGNPKDLANKKTIAEVFRINSTVYFAEGRTKPFIIPEIIN